MHYKDYDKWSGFKVWTEINDWDWIFLIFFQQHIKQQYDENAGLESFLSNTSKL